MARRSCLRWKASLPASSTCSKPRWPLTGRKLFSYPLSLHSAVQRCRATCLLCQDLPAENHLHGGPLSRRSLYCASLRFGMTKRKGALPSRVVAEQKGAEALFHPLGGPNAQIPPVEKHLHERSAETTTLNGSAPLPFVIPTGAQRSGGICGSADLSRGCFSAEFSAVQPYLEKF